MDMTLEQYILNPMGKSNAVMNAATREITRKLYVRKFDNLLLRENGRIEYYLYKDEATNTFWAHIKVPSETVKKFYYDVVFKFSSTEKTPFFGEDLFKCSVKFFSNDPAFMYTYCYVFAKNDLLIPELMQKVSKTALRSAPTEKNSAENIGYVKVIYFAYLLMQNRKLNKVKRFEAECNPLDKSYLLLNVMKMEDKVQDRQDADRGVSHRKKITVTKQELNNMQRSMGKNADLSNSRLQVTTAKKVKNIKNTKEAVKAIKNANKVRKANSTAYNQRGKKS